MVFLVSLSTQTTKKFDQEKLGRRVLEGGCQVRWKWETGRTEPCSSRAVVLVVRMLTVEAVVGVGRVTAPLVDLGISKYQQCITYI